MEYKHTPNCVVMVNYHVVFCPKYRRQILVGAIKKRCREVFGDVARENRKLGRSFNHSLHSWSFYQLQQFIEYKAKLCGIPLTYVEPQNTSKECSRCGNIGIRDSKKFVCHTCGHVDHADANASFNIAQRPSIEEGVGLLHIDRDICKGSTDTPRGATL